MPKRKIWLLGKDRKVSSSKKTIAQLRDALRLDDAQWVLIPIAQTSTTYIAVDGDAILMRKFARAEIRYHMQLKSTVGRYRKGEDRTERLQRDYYTSSITALTHEELYNALYNVLVFGYIKDMISGDAIDSYPFLDVVEMEVSLYDEKGRILETFNANDKNLSSIEDSPFYISRTSALCGRVANHFGLIYADQWLTAPNLYFKSWGKLVKWYEATAVIDLYSDISHVLISNPYTKSFSMMTDDEYDAALRIRSINAFITPLAVMDSGATGTNNSRYLSVANAYDLPKYYFEENRYYGATEDMTSRIYHDFGPSAMEIFSYCINDSEDVMTFLDNISFVLKVYHEAGKDWALSNYCTVESDDEEMQIMQDMDRRCTVLGNFSLEYMDAGDAPVEDGMLTIYTDIYEDYLPNLKEVCYLLLLEEKESKALHEDIS
jgi:hypothetical protein